ncbi:MAG: TIGR00730 family Rossman fold protein [Candidatus Leucobacter sulfamidivorax]|nr:TIGR00730 family Rossman fold protein [Candidatus Leucobacter sulfamidivorax]
MRAEIEVLLDAAGVDWQRKLITRIIESGIDLGLDGTSRLDLKISAAALEEMHSAFRLFAPFAGTPKATIFGSARTQAHDPLSLQAERVSRSLAGLGWMVVTGAGPGIMEAAAIGAGPEHSLGVSIRLPFEELPQHAIAHNDRLVSMKYFFTRKLMLVKESLGFVCLPGGFGTMDETFELLTLQQTGKMVPVPIVLLDRPGGDFWRGFERFATQHLEGTGMISPGDLDRVLVTDSADAAVAEITGFWRNYDSLRWVPDRGGSEASDASGSAATAAAYGAKREVPDRGGNGRNGGTSGAGGAGGDAPPQDPVVVAGGGTQDPAGDQLVMRLRSAPTDEEIESLNERFGDLLLSGRIERSEPLAPERADRDRLELPRIVLTPRRRAVGELFRIIRALNELPSAPALATAPPEPRD